MQPDDILGYVVVAAVVMIPGLAISARIALRPIVESIARLRELTTSAETQRSRALEAEIEELRSVTDDLRNEVRALREGATSTAPFSRPSSHPNKRAREAALASPACPSGLTRSAPPASKVISRWGVRRGGSPTGNVSRHGSLEGDRD